jgi:hypothetical protein
MWHSMFARGMNAWHNLRIECLEYACALAMLRPKLLHSGVQPTGGPSFVLGFLVIPHPASASPDSFLLI